MERVRLLATAAFGVEAVVARDPGVDLGDITDLGLFWSRSGQIDEIRTASAYTTLMQ